MNTLAHKYNFIRLHTDKDVDICTAFLHILNIGIGNKKSISIENAINQINAAYGISVNDPVIRYLVDKSPNFNLHYKSHTIERTNNYQQTEVQKKKYRSEYEKLIKHCHEYLPNIDNLEQVLEKLISVNSDYKVQNTDSIALEINEPELQQLAHFLEQEALKNSEIYIFFEQLILSEIYSRLLTSAPLTNGLPSRLESAKNIVLFFDTNFLLRLLDLQEPLLYNAAFECLKIYKNAGFKLSVLSITIEDLHKIFDGAIESLKNYQRSGDVISPQIARYMEGITAACIRKGITATELDNISRNIEAILFNNFGIGTIVQNITTIDKAHSSYRDLLNRSLVSATKREISRRKNRHFPIQTEMPIPDNFEDMINSEEYNKIPPEICARAENQTDYLMSICQVVRSRRRSVVTKFEQANALIVTCSKKLRSWNKNNIGQREIPYAYLDYELAGMIWILDPKVKMNFEAKIILSKCLQGTRLDLKTATKVTELSSKIEVNAESILDAVFFNSTTVEEYKNNKDNHFNLQVIKIIDNPNYISYKRRYANASFPYFILLSILSLLVTTILSVIAFVVNKDSVVLTAFITFVYLSSSIATNANYIKKLAQKVFSCNYPSMATAFGRMFFRVLTQKEGIEKITFLAEKIISKNPCL
ncbi:hypothetical protein CHISP_3131 [Chitinispirillum alkaliphilum]|nr:hypothetical protein CHISP_3131 [Chitinispirillum alkaliphilum]